MPLMYRSFRHKETGEICYMPAGRYGNFLNTIKKLVNYIRYNIPHYYMAHVTLTVAENVSEVNSTHLHRVIEFIRQQLKRAGSEFLYVAVKELQERGAIHYHILCIYGKPYVFPYSNDIAASWSLGFVKITAPKLRLKLYSIANYIGKYLGKGYEYEQLNVKKSFTASQIKQIYKLSAKRLADAVGRFGKEMAESLSCSYRKLYLNVEERTYIFGNLVIKKEKKLLYTYRSDWELIRDGDGRFAKPLMVTEPF